MEDTEQSKNNHTPRLQSILDVAAKIFAEKGYHRATLAEIAQDVGIKKGSLYYYISSKEELLYEIVKFTLDLYRKNLKGLLTSDERPDIILRKAIIGHLAPVDKEFNKIYVFLNEINNLSEKFHNKVNLESKEIAQLWINALERGKEEGFFKPSLDTKITFLSIMNMCNWALNWYKLKGKYTMVEIAEIFADNLLDGVRKNN